MGDHKGGGGRRGRGVRVAAGRSVISSETSALRREVFDGFREQAGEVTNPNALRREVFDGLRAQADTTPEARAQSYVTGLKRLSKKEVFEEWRAQTLGRVSNPDIREQRRSWMVYDIIRARYGQGIADRVA